MLFNSIDYIIFFILTVIFYYHLPYKYRWILLVIASCIFYMAFIPVYIFIKLFIVTVDYFVAIKIEESVGHRKKWWLCLSIISGLAVLFFYKYLNFTTNSLNAIAQLLHWNYSIQVLNLILPIGVSFFIFQSFSYVFEVYYGRQRAERHYGYYFLYVSFFPQLLAGPIERPQNLIKQIHEKQDFRYREAVEGIKLIAWGFFKKVVIADHLASYVNFIYAKPSVFQGMSLVAATVFFADQIYCDFSGYSDIARGSAKILGFNLMINFRRPYSSKSFQEFWHRWHISLSSWFRDYLYIPLGGNRVLHSRWVMNIYITFILSGLWHGANSTFMIWGMLHGTYLLIERFFQDHTKNIWGNIKLGVTGSVLNIIFIFGLTCVAWVFFRAQSLPDAFYVISHFGLGLKEYFTNIFVFHGHRIAENGILYPFMIGGIFHKTDLGLIVIAIFMLELVEYLHEKNKLALYWGQQPIIVRYLGYVTLVLIIFDFGCIHREPFIYFQF